MSGSTFKIKAAHREVTTGALLAWRGTMEPENTAAVQGWSCNGNSFPSSSVAVIICGISHLHGSMEPKKGQKTSRVPRRERGNTEHSKDIPHKSTQGLVSSSTDIIPKDSYAHQASFGSILALQDPALCYWGSNKPRYSRVCWVKNPHMKQEKR